MTKLSSNEAVVKFLDAMRDRSDDSKTIKTICLMLTQEYSEDDVIHLHAAEQLYNWVVSND